MAKFSNFFRSFRYVWLALCLSYSSVLVAQDSLRVDSTKIYKIPEVVVSIHRFIPKSVSPVQILSGKNLENLSSHSVADALRYFSGMQIKDYGGIGGLKTVNIRSMGTNHVGIFYDGVELGNAQNGTIDLGKFSLDNMESITLYNGEKNSVFQSAKDFGASGSVYLQSKSPYFEDDEKYHVTGTLKGGSFWTINPSFLWEQKLTDNIAFSASAEYLYTAGKYKFSYQTLGGYDTTAVRQNGDVNALRAELGLYGKLKDGHWRAKAYFYNSERGYPGAVVRGKFTHEDRQWDSNFFLQSSFQKAFGDVYSLLLKGKYAYDYLHYLADPNRDESLMYVNNVYRQQEAYLSTANRFQMYDFWDASVSVDFQWNGLDANLYNFVYPNRYTAMGALATALYFDQFKFQASVLATYVYDQLTTDTVSTADYFHLSPALFLSYQPFKKIDLNLRAFYKQSMRMPTFNDLYYTFIGSSRLKPEKTTQYNVGITYNQPFDGVFSLLTFQIDGYFNQVTNKIIATPTSNFFRWTMINLGYVEIVGTDVAVQTNFTFSKSYSVNARLNYTYQRAKDLGDKTSTYFGGQIPYIPWHSGSVVLNADLKTWVLNYSFIYTGERYNSSANIPVNYEQPWYTHDIALSKQFQWQKVGLRVTVEVNNLFNQQYEVVRSYPMPGTNFRLIAQVKL
ncbi:MAG TPA: TonB-dependent receptor [Paludibacteraceae bacterium]|nr:TonB-dependent receptor [Paludibacteraceae bacterium]